MSPSYIQEYLEGDVDIFIHKEYHGLIRVKLQSRHVSSKQYLLWIQFSESEISAWYCRCRAGAVLLVSASMFLLVYGTLPQGGTTRRPYLPSKTGPSLLLMPLLLMNPVKVVTVIWRSKSYVPHPEISMIFVFHIMSILL